MKFETKAICVGQSADQATGATIVPIYQTSTFTQEEVNKTKDMSIPASGILLAQHSMLVWLHWKKANTD